MVATPILQAVIAGIGTVIFAISGIVIAVWRHVENLHNDEDSERIDDMQDFRWGSVSAEIQSLYLDVEDYLDENPDEEETDIEYEAHLTNVIRDGVDLEDLEDLIENVGKLGEPSQLYNKHQEAYEECFWNFIKASGSLFLLDATIVIALVSGSKPFEGGFLLLNVAFALGGVMLAYEGFSKWSLARSRKQEFDEMWQEYRYEY